MALHQDDLRGRLEEERRRTNELAAKVHVAERITDLLFKIQPWRPPSPSIARAPPPAP